MRLFHLSEYVIKVNLAHFLRANVFCKVIIEKSRGGRYYEAGIEIWAGFGPVGIIEKKTILADNEQLLGPIFSSFRWQKKIYKKKTLLRPH